MSNEQKEKKQIIAQVEDMTRFLRKQISDNQAGIKAAESRIGAAELEIARSTQEIQARINQGEELAQKLATWESQKITLENL